ncbi:calcium-dependent kinase CPK1 adapter protein, partial [Trifolium pratense]
MQKEAEVQKLMEENVKLSTLLDKKEAQLLALNEQWEEGPSNLEFGCK